MCLTEQHLQQLQARGLDPELCVRMGLDSSSQLGGSVAIPYYVGERVVGNKYRTLTPPKRFSQDPGRPKVFYNFSAITDPALADMPLIITEGELDCLSAIQAGYLRTVSVPDGAPAQEQGAEDQGRKYSYIVDALPALKPIKEIVLATDGDGPGVNLMNDLAVRLGKARCKWLQYPKGCKDLGDVLATFGLRGITATIQRAKWWAVNGLATMAGLPPYTEPVPHDIGLPDFSLYKVRPSDLCVVSGISSHGKTAWVTEMACRLSTAHGWRIGYASFENVPQTDMRRALRRWFNAKPPGLQTAEEIALADRWIEDRFVWLSPTEDQDVTLPWLLECMAAAVVRYGVRMLVIDPFNEIALDRPRDMTQTEYIGYVLIQMRRFARKHNVHLIIVAHPAKLQRNKEGQYPFPSLFDVEESRHWYGKCDSGVIVHQENGGTTIRLAKSRNHDAVGKPGDAKVKFNTETGRYTAIPQEMGRYV